MNYGSVTVSTMATPVLISTLAVPIIFYQGLLARPGQALCTRLACPSMPRICSNDGYKTVLWLLLSLILWCVSTCLVFKLFLVCSSNRCFLFYLPLLNSLVFKYVSTQRGIFLYRVVIATVWQG